MDLSHHRQDYQQGSIDIDSVESCPLKQFEIWFKQARDENLLEPNAMVLSTVNPEGTPTQRTVLLKYFDENGFVFFTNYNSRKAGHIADNPNVSLLFPWYALQRQVEVSGVGEKVSASESLKYFALRPRGSQLGAWVSEQSTVVSTRSLLQSKLTDLKQKFSSGSVPMPPAWGGYRIKPNRIEFWQGGTDRLHDRIEYKFVSADQPWQRRRLAP